MAVVTLPEAIDSYSLRARSAPPPPVKTCSSTPVVTDPAGSMEMTMIAQRSTSSSVGESTVDVTWFPA